MEKCQWCKYWAPQHEDRTQASYGYQECRRHSPVMHEVRHGNQVDQFPWPRTSHNDWCGDFERVPLRHEDMTVDEGEEATLAQSSVQILNSSDQWLDYEMLRRKLSENDKFAVMIKNSPNYFYTMLRRLEVRGEIERLDGMVRGLRKGLSP